MAEEDDMNELRAEWADEALNTFATRTGLNLELERDDAVADLLCDLGHYCDCYALDFKALIDRAIRNWEHEVLHPDE